MLYAKRMDPRVKPAGDGGGWREHRIKSSGTRFSVACVADHHKYLTRAVPIKLS
jgi:hypothetical protein